MVSVAVKRYHDHRNSYKGNIYQRWQLTVGRFSPLSWPAAWQPTGRRGAGYILIRRQQEVDSVTLSKVWAKDTSKTSPTVTHFLQQGHTYFNKATPPNSATPFGIMGSVQLHSDYYRRRAVVLKKAEPNIFPCFYLIFLHKIFSFKL